MAEKTHKCNTCGFLDRCGSWIGMVINCTSQTKCNGAMYPLVEMRGLEILKEETYRSKPTVNMANDMVRVTLTCRRHKWREIKKILSNDLNIQGTGDGG